MKIISWNVNGIRSCAKKGLLDYINTQKPDILCLQETKAELEQLEPELANPEGYFSYFNSCEIKKGYSGVAIYSRQKPIRTWTTFSVDKFNVEGRILWAEYPDLIVLNLYFPNGQKDDDRLQYKLQFNDQLVEELKQYAGKKVVVCGDYNTAHNEIDLKHPKANEKSSGFLPIERAWMDSFSAFGYTDTFRHFYPDKVQYSWWTYRAGAREKNVGWRIDYHFVSPELLPCVKEAFIEDQVMGSDHCPVGIKLEL